MATVRMQYRNDGFANVSNYSGMIEVTAPTWRAKRWAIKQLKREARNLEISLKKKDGGYHAGYENSNKVEHQLLPALSKCWVSPTLGDLRKGKILDLGF